MFSAHPGMSIVNHYENSVLINSFKRPATLNFSNAVITRTEPSRRAKAMAARAL